MVLLIKKHLEHKKQMKDRRGSIKQDAGEKTNKTIKKEEENKKINKAINNAHI